VPVHHTRFEMSLQMRVVQGLVLVGDVVAVWVTKVKIKFLFTLMFLKQHTVWFNKIMVIIFIKLYLSNWLFIYHFEKVHIN
jgi:hypothetical protein